MLENEREKLSFFCMKDDPVVFGSLKSVPRKGERDVYHESGAGASCGWCV
jgi:hypothetical protein